MFELVKGAIWTGIRKTPAAEHPLSQLVLNDDEIYLFSVTESNFQFQQYTNVVLKNDIAKYSYQKPTGHFDGRVCGIMAVR